MKTFKFQIWVLFCFIIYHMLVKLIIPQIMPYSYDITRGKASWSIYPRHAKYLVSSAGQRDHISRCLSFIRA